LTSKSIHFLLYKSDAQTDIDGGEDLDILVQASANNAPNDITGFLVRFENQFIQVLEGPEENIADTYERILNDKRHKDCRLMFEGRAQERRFPKWAMSYAALSETKDLSEVETLLAKPIEDEATFDRCISIFQKELEFLESEGRVAF
jgi:hypothetical protein